MSGAAVAGAADTVPAVAAERSEDGYEHDLAVVLLTQGTRPVELARAIASVRAQERIHARVVLVVNGAAAPVPASPELAPDLVVVLPDNEGIPQGRNVGAAAADAEVVMFLDDDAELLDRGLLAAAFDRFKADPRLSAISLRLVDEAGVTQQRHIPRLGSGSAERPGPVTHFVGGASVLRSSAFQQVGGFDPRFFYAMEESDLSWRLLDAGWSIWYSADLKVFHPRTLPSRHRGYAKLTARNRLWMAWRSLPAPMLVAYMAVWTAAAALRGAPVKELLDGYREAMASRPERRPMRWRTVLRMTMLGRPPVV